MTTAQAIWFFLSLAFVAANLPWLSGRVFFIARPRGGTKSIFWRLGEWLALYFVVGFVGMGLERVTEGHIHSQGWIFYVVTLCMFAVFAIPGFVYHFNMRPMLRRS